MLYLIFANIALISVIIYLGIKLLDYRDSRRTLYRLMNHTNIGYYKYRYKDGVVIDVNKGFADIIEMGLKRKELKGRALSELIIYVDDEEKLRQKIKKNRYLRNYEYHFKTLEGKDKWMLQNSYIFRDPYTREELVEAWVEDISEEIISYEKMKKSQQRYENLFKNSGDMVIIYSLDEGNIIEANPQATNISGYTKEELIGRPFEKIFHPIYRKLLKDYEQDLIFRGFAHMESIMVCKNGSYREISVTLSIAEEEEGRIAIAIARDISRFIKEREEQALRKKELDKLWKASMEREERLKHVRTELRKAQKQIELLKGSKSDEG